MKSIVVALALAVSGCAVFQPELDHQVPEPVVAETVIPYEFSFSLEDVVLEQFFHETNAPDWIHLLGRKIDFYFVPLFNDYVGIVFDSAGTPIARSRFEREIITKYYGREASTETIIKKDNT